MSFLMSLRWRHAAIALLFLAVLVIPYDVAQAQTYCPLYKTSGATNKRLKFEPDYIQGTTLTYQDSGCTQLNGTTTSPSGGWAYGLSPSSALATCRREQGASATATRDSNSQSGYIYVCRVPRQRSSSDKNDEDPPVRPYIPTGHLAERDRPATVGAGRAEQRHRVPAPGRTRCGASRWLSRWACWMPVDVWGKVDGMYTVCFPQSGVIYFLDAAMAPRTVSLVSTYADGSYTCADLDRPGTLVLVAREDPVETEIDLTSGLPGETTAPELRWRTVRSRHDTTYITGLSRLACRVDWCRRETTAGGQPTHRTLV